MHDLIGAYERLERMYRLYIRSAFPLRSEALEKERDTLLREGQILSQPPLIETVPVYPSSGHTLDKATRNLPPQYAGLAELGKELLPAPLELYSHQRDSLREVLINEKDLVVTTGTGSGKTECFLLPLMAHLAHESATWAAPNQPDPDREWWNSRGSRQSQWAHITRPTALRAIILYPLNALVEDQLRRLRKTLDSDDVHRWLDRQRDGNRITFGRYTGLTPVPGEEDGKKRNRLRKELGELDEQRQDVLSKLASNPNLDKEAEYYFPRLDGGEMWSRWDMQETPPDILITNYVMLNIMMMRSIEDDIFKKTKAWLKSDPKAQFFLIIDELHSYRGTPGTEVAYILRLLLYRLGLEPNSPKLRILTTTASLEDDQDGRTFLREFFGRDNFAFITGTEQPPLRGTRTYLTSYQSAFEEFAQNVQPDWKSGPPDVAVSRIRMEMGRLAARLGQQRLPRQSEEERLGKALVLRQVPDALRDACQAVNGSVRATQLPDLDAELFRTTATTATNGVTSDAMRGLMLAIGMSKDPKKFPTARARTPLLSPSPQSVGLL
jgi:ATP-dependent helicase YprA (DUF1998 family)